MEKAVSGHGVFIYDAEAAASFEVSGGWLHRLKDMYLNNMENHRTSGRRRGK